MKKNLQNAMAQNFQKMVGSPAPQETKAEAKNTNVPKSNQTAKKAENISVETETLTETVPVEIPVQQPVQAVPVNQVPVTATQNVNPMPVYTTPQPTVPVNNQINVPVNQNIMPQQVNVPVMPINEVQEQEIPVKSKNNSKKTIPLIPEEKSSGVLHIRLGELRSYVDFMTQSGKISYQQYISNLIEQDYEKNKEMYLKYKSFMDQLNL